VRLLSNFNINVFNILLIASPHLIGVDRLGIATAESRTSHEFAVIDIVSHMILIIYKDIALMFMYC